MLFGSRKSSLDTGIRQIWPSNRAKLGTYHGFGRVAAQSTVTLDRVVKYRLPVGLGFFSYDSANNMAVGTATGGSGGSVGGYVGLRETLIVRVPLAFSDGSTLANVAAGNFDTDYTTAFTAILALGYSEVILTLGHEFNFPYPWCATGLESTYVAAFQHIANVARAVSSSFKILWNPAQRVWSYAGAYPTNPDDCYPGNSYVDYIGIDLYEEWNIGANQFDAQLRWDNEMVGNTGTAVVGNTLPYCLAWCASFAASKSKPIILAEVGSGFNDNANKNMGDNPVFYTNLLAWIAANNVYAWCIFDTSEVDTNNNYSLGISSSITGIAPSNPLNEKPQCALVLRNSFA